MNELLQKTQAAVLQKANPKLAPVIKKVVEAGKKVMYSKESRDLFIQQVKGGTDPESIGAAVAKLMGILSNQSKGTIPPEVLVPAATLLMCEGLQFMEEAGLVEITPDFLAAVTKAMGSAVLQLLGVSPEKLTGLLQKQGQPPAQPIQPAPDAQPGIVQGAM